MRQELKLECGCLIEMTPNTRKYAKVLWNMTDERLCDEHKREYLSFGDRKRSRRLNRMAEVLSLDDENCNSQRNIDRIFAGFPGMPNFLAGNKPLVNVRLKANRAIEEGESLEVNNGFRVNKKSSIQILIRNTGGITAKDVNITLEGDILEGNKEFTFKKIGSEESITDAFVITPKKKGMQSITIKMQYNYRMTRIVTKEARAKIEVSDREKRGKISDTIFDSLHGGWNKSTK